VTGAPVLVAGVGGALAGVAVGVPVRPPPPAASAAAGAAAKASTAQPGMSRRGSLKNFSFVGRRG